MKKIALISIFLVFVALSSSYAYDRGHTWDNGVVEAVFEKTFQVPMEDGTTRSVTSNMMTISGKTYEVDAKCKFTSVRKTGKGHGVKIRNIRLSDILEGDRVLVKRIGKILIEVSVKEN
jgi:hypothetical protein